MTRTLVLSGRNPHNHLADACAHDLENAFLDAAGADLLTPATDRAGLAPSYDLMIVAGVSFHRVVETLQALRRAGPLPAAGRRIAYVFGAYRMHTRRPRNPIRRLRTNLHREFAIFDRVYLGIADSAELIGADLGVPARYLPMAADVLSVAAEPFASRRDRPIAVTGFGRQHRGITDALCDRLNRPGSDELFYHTNYYGVGDTEDIFRYRAMFWQILRQSRLSMAFDHFFANIYGSAQHSYVGPRWFEGLAAGSVVIGRAPPTPDRARLLDWPDAAVDLSADPAEAVEEVLGLLADEDRLRRASRRTLVEMNRRHDWSHRLAEILETEGLTPGPGLRVRLDRLAARAEALAAGEAASAAA